MKGSEQLRRADAHHDGVRAVDGFRDALSAPGMMSLSSSIMLQGRCVERFKS